MAYLTPPTPALDALFEPTLAPLPKEERQLVLSWIYCHLGRLMFPLHKHDQWRVALFLTGGPIKSLVAGVLFHILPQPLIGVLWNSHRSHFELDDLWRRSLWVCMDVDANFSFDVNTLQSMIRGDRVRVDALGRAPRHVHWTSPGLMYGTPPAWTDEALLSRFVVIDMVGEDSDSLRRRLEKESFAIFTKLTLAYLHHTDPRRLDKQPDVWSAMPAAFHKWHTDFTAAAAKTLTNLK